MAFQRPDLTTLLTRIESDIESRLPNVDARLRRNVLNAIARTLAGMAHGVYGYLDYLARQIIISTAEAPYLDYWASDFGVPRKAAAAAAGSVTFTGTNGSSIPAGTVVQRSDGAEYTTNALATIASGAATAAVTAVVAGVDGNAAAASVFALASPVSGVASSATVAAGGITGGADIEGDDDLRSRLLSRIQSPPQGGADFDYVAWALEVAGVTRAWCYPGEGGLGKVAVRFVMDDTYTNGIPLAGDVAAVQAHINSLRPVTADVTVSAPTAVALNFTIQVSPTDAATKAAVVAELTDMIRREAVPGGTILLSHINQAIGLAAGETDHVLVSPAANVTRTTGQITTMGTVTWQ